MRQDVLLVPVETAEIGEREKQPIQPPRHFIAVRRVGVIGRLWLLDDDIEIWCNAGSKSGAATRRVRALLADHVSVTRRTRVKLYRIRVLSGTRVSGPLPFGRMIQNADSVTNSKRARYR